MAVKLLFNTVGLGAYSITHSGTMTGGLGITEFESSMDLLSGDNYITRQIDNDYIQLDFYVGNSGLLLDYLFLALGIYNETGGVITLSGSNDGSSYTTIQTYTYTDYRIFSRLGKARTDGASETFLKTFTAGTAYKYYRVKFEISSAPTIWAVNKIFIGESFQTTRPIQITDIRPANNAKIFKTSSGFSSITTNLKAPSFDLLIAGEPDATLSYLESKLIRLESCYCLIYDVDNLILPSNEGVTYYGKITNYRVDKHKPDYNNISLTLDGAI